MRPATTVISPSNVLEAITCDVKSGNAFEAGGQQRAARSNRR
jgi:hypothetical protein